MSLIRRFHMLAQVLIVLATLTHAYGRPIEDHVRPPQGPRLKTKCLLLIGKALKSVLPRQNDGVDGELYRKYGMDQLLNIWSDIRDKIPGNSEQPIIVAPNWAYFRGYFIPRNYFLREMFNVEGITDGSQVGDLDVNQIAVILNKNKIPRQVIKEMPVARVGLDGTLYFYTNGTRQLLSSLFRSYFKRSRTFYRGIGSFEYRWLRFFKGLGSLKDNVLVPHDLLEDYHKLVSTSTDPSHSTEFADLLKTSPTVGDLKRWSIDLIYTRLEGIFGTPDLQTARSWANERKAQSGAGYVVEFKYDFRRHFGNVGTSSIYWGIEGNAFEVGFFSDAEKMTVFNSMIERLPIQTRE